jgi:hypothetical protein
MLLGMGIFGAVTQAQAQVAVSEDGASRDSCMEIVVTARRREESVRRPPSKMNQ